MNDRYKLTRIFIVGILTSCSLIAQGQSIYDSAHIARFKKYQSVLSSFREYIKKTSDIGIDVFRPDYSKPDGGNAYKLTQKLSNDLKIESVELGLKQYFENGWHQAIVYYDNSNTNTNSRYKLDVKVESNRVITIIFPDGGSLHTGQNNSGYAYSGGDLDLDHHISGEIIRAKTVVKIMTSNSKLTYTVLID